jgi:hypothetical protein
MIAPSLNHHHMTRPIRRLQYEAVNRRHGFAKTPALGGKHVRWVCESWNRKGRKNFRKKGDEQRNSTVDNYQKLQC